MSRSPLIVPAARPALMLIVVACLLLALPAYGARVEPTGSPESVWLEISGKQYGYFALTPDSPLEFTIEGPAIFEPILRWRFVDNTPGVDVDVELLMDGTGLLHQVFRPDRGRSTYRDHPEWRGGSPVKVAIDIPRGTHSVEIRLHSPGSGTLDVNPVLKPSLVLPWRFDWRLEAGVAYDSNIFRYADADVDDFLDGIDADSYQAEYLDDIRIEPSVDLSLVREKRGESETELRFSADGRLTTVNPEKSFVKLGGRIKQSHEGYGYGLFGYYGIPSYHVRELWDADVTSGDPYRACELQKHAMRGEVGIEGLLPVDLILRGKFEYTGYNQDFVEYDSKAWIPGVVVIARPVRGVRIDLGYSFRTLEALGYDEAIEEDAVSDDSDISYEQNEYGLKVRWDVGSVRGFRTALTLGARLSQRYYQTDRSYEDDPYHSGREDTYWTFSGRSTHRLREGVALEAFYEHRRRSSDSDYLDELGVDKDYTANRVGLRLIFEGERILD